MKRLGPLFLLLAVLPLEAACPWPLWQTFQQTHVSADGRVIDHGREDKATTSEGQAYGLFFALLADDRPAFARLLQWTENNLSAGRLDQGLPAWLWGRRQDGQWTVLDDNSASDADLWLAYALLEAGRMWQKPEYQQTGRQLLANVRKHESLRLPGIGWVVLPGRKGFQEEEGRVRLNPSYPVLFHWRRFAQEDSWWQRLIPATVKQLKQSAPHGLAPDWAVYRLGKGIRPEAVGSYDAIRVYLWLGMLSPADPERTALVAHFRPMLEHVRRLGHVPLKTRPQTGQAEGQGPAGFYAALEPLWAETVMRLTRAADGSGYYNQVLRLFAEGWRQRYRPDARGRLQAVVSKGQADCS